MTIIPCRNPPKFPKNPTSPHTQTKTQYSPIPNPKNHPTKAASEWLHGRPYTPFYTRPARNEAVGRADVIRGGSVTSLRSPPLRKGRPSPPVTSSIKKLEALSEPRSRWLKLEYQSDGVWIRF